MRVLKQTNLQRITAGYNAVRYVTGIPVMQNKIEFHNFVGAFVR